MNSEEIYILEIVYFPQFRTSRMRDTKMNESMNPTRETRGSSPGVL